MAKEFFASEYAGPAGLEAWHPGYVSPEPETEPCELCDGQFPESALSVILIVMRQGLSHPPQERRFQVCQACANDQAAQG